MYEKIPKLLQFLQNLPRAVPPHPHFLSCLTNALVWLITPHYSWKCSCVSLTSGPTRGHRNFCLMLPAHSNILHFNLISHVVYNINPFISHAHAGIILCSTQIIFLMSYWGRILQAIHYYTINVWETIFAIGVTWRRLLQIVFTLTVIPQ
jgi:hypothetical protein